MATIGGGMTPPDGSFAMPQWLFAIYTAVTGSVGAVILALVNRAPRFQEVVNNSSKALIESQNRRITELSELVGHLMERVTLLENALIENGVAVPTKTHTPPVAAVASKGRKAN